MPATAPAKISADHAGTPTQMEPCSHFPSVPLSQGSPENTPGKGVPWIFGKSERRPLAVDKTAKDLDQCPHARWAPRAALGQLLGSPPQAMATLRCAGSRRQRSRWHRATLLPADSSPGGGGGVFRNLPHSFRRIKDSVSRSGPSENVQIKSNPYLTGRERKVRESQTSS